MKNKIFENKIKEVMNTAMENLKPLIDSNIVVGKVIKGDGLDVIPITKVTLGFVAGGGEYYSELKDIRRDTEYPFSGGSGGGISVHPLGFLVIKNSSVEFVKIESKTIIEKLIETIPEIAKFIDKNFSKDSEK
ncbi:MAG: GerW family sporulation protein [Clostridia bacterium]|nr:GerW family sporulation protein [Clostridia bacterium]